MDQPSGETASLIRAAFYVRMSTEHQRYSIEFQTVALSAYAAEHGYEIANIYTDAGISGLRLERRSGLKQLLADALNGVGGFSVILTYDVSRWGRFQDPDQSAYYEFICKEAGVRVEYCAEPFDNDGSLASTLVKHIKRAMAAEYSRELSEKVIRAKRGLTEKGFWCGGNCVYGFRRQVINPDGTLGPVLEPGQRKALQGHRVILVPGPEAEVRTVQRIFRDYAICGLNTGAIARMLNADDEVRDGRRQWTRDRVYRVLTDEQYAGVRIGARRTVRMFKERRLPPEEWFRQPCAGLVDRRLYDLVQANIRAGNRSLSDAQLLDELRRVLAIHGRLTANIIRGESKCRPGLFERRFGTLVKAYRLAGYQPTRLQSAAAARYLRTPLFDQPFTLPDADLIERLKRLRRRTGRVTANLIDHDPDLPSHTTCRRRFGDMLTICRLAGCAPSERQMSSYRVNRWRKGQAARRKEFAETYRGGEVGRDS